MVCLIWAIFHFGEVPDTLASGERMAAIMRHSSSKKLKPPTKYFLNLNKAIGPILLRLDFYYPRD